MPTARTLAFLITALLLYFFANQTQVGWIYIMAALMAGTVVAAWWLGWGALKQITVDRQLTPSERRGLLSPRISAPERDVLATEPPHEGDTVTVQLTFRNTRADWHVSATERCPFAPPESPARALSLFIPTLPKNEPVPLRYEVVVDRRGLHEFPALSLQTPAPFGLFRRRRVLPEPTRLLVYPEVRPLRRLAFFARQPAALLARPRAGLGAEIIGVRPFRSGDSPRHLHWRSVARTGQLISKEFADESQPGLTLVLDLHRYPYPKTESKHTPFEWAVKLAASLGDYAQHHRYALHLLADESAWPPPPGPLSSTALLEYLARIQPTGSQTIHHLLGSPQSLTTHYVIVLLPWPDLAIVGSVIALHQQGHEVMAIVLDPESFPTRASNAQGATMVGRLAAAGVESHLIRYGQDWVEQLHAEAADLPIVQQEAAGAPAP